MWWNSDYTTILVCFISLTTNNLCLAFLLIFWFVSNLYLGKEAPLREICSYPGRPSSHGHICSHLEVAQLQSDLLATEKLHWDAYRSRTLVKGHSDLSCQSRDWIGDLLIKSIRFFKVFFLQFWKSIGFHHQVCINLCQYYIITEE